MNTKNAGIAKKAIIVENASETKDAKSAKMKKSTN